MSRSISSALLQQRHGERLGLHWVAGEALASERHLTAEGWATRPALVGFLNLIHPNRIQVIGTDEMLWLEALAPQQRQETLAAIMAIQPAAVIVADGLDPAADLTQAAADHLTPLLATRQPARALVGFLEHQLARELAEPVIVHGVFMEIFTMGVLITGESGTGKSELALELLSRGHRLIADDGPEFTQLTPDIVEGRCPPVLADCLEVRGLGIVNVRRMFGDAAIKSSKYLRLIIHLHPPGSAQPAAAQTGDRLRGNISRRRVCELDIPQISLPVLAGRNLAVMAEVAVRDCMLRLQGFDAATEFVQRHARLMAGAE